ncbi:MAG TPA: SatD family protein [Salinimicrobium sp.]|nr:SatD family protein [Salinimicrobium sp.]
MVAIITGDIVDSSDLKPEELKLILNTLQEEFDSIEKASKTKTDFKIYRGDSFQGMIPQPEMALRNTLQIKSAINKIQFKSAEKKTGLKADFRVAIGIGNLDLKRKNISESNGQAFQFSGRTLDEMKNDSRKTKLKCPDENINSEFNASLFLLDFIMEKWSSASAEVIYYFLKGKKEREIAAEINISQSAVNQRKKAAGWDAVSVLLKRYEEVALKNFVNG